VIGEIFDKARGSAVVAAQVPGQWRLPYRPLAETLADRDRRVRSMVRHAAETVPYYRRLFTEQRIDPCEVRTAGDLDCLPLLDKTALAADPDAFLSESPVARHRLRLVTSGTSGLRVTVYHDRRSALANIAFSERERAVLVRLCGKALGYRVMGLAYRGNTGEQVRGLYHRATWFPGRPRRLDLPVSEPMDRVVEAINRFRPDVLGGYGSYLGSLFKYVASGSMPLFLPRVVAYSADVMTPDDRAFIERRFGLPVISQYNAVEAFKIGFTCEQRDGFHLHPDLCHLRVIRADGSSAAPGEQGEVIISNLVNRATVLLNYRLGDRAALAEGACPCGRTLPLLTDLDGRVEELIELPNGRAVYPRLIWRLLKWRAEVLRYQLVQRAPTEFVFRLMTTDRHAYDRLLPDLLAELHELMGPGVSIQPEHHAHLGMTGRAKFRPIVPLGRDTAAP
jgi:phenylacetate-CoA ligase